VCLQCVPLTHWLLESESIYLPACIINLQLSRDQVPSEGFPVVSVRAHSGGISSGIVGSRSLHAPHIDPSSLIVIDFSRPLDRLSLSPSVPTQYDHLLSRRAMRVTPVHGLFIPASLVLHGMTLHIASQDVGWSCTTFGLEPLHALASLAVNHYLPVSRATRAVVSPDSVIGMPIDVVGRVCSQDIACRLRSS